MPTARGDGRPGAHIRSGPGTNFPVVGVARNGDSSEIIGRSADGNWWVVSVPSAPGGMGWCRPVSWTATGADEVPRIAPPPRRPHRRRCRRRQLPLPLRSAATRYRWQPHHRDRILVEPDDHRARAVYDNWSVQNVRQSGCIPSWRDLITASAPASGNEVVCPSTTTTMQVQMRDGTTQIRQVTLTSTWRPRRPIQFAFGNTLGCRQLQQRAPGSVHSWSTVPASI